MRGEGVEEMEGVVDGGGRRSTVYIDLASSSMSRTDPGTVRT